MLSKKWFIFSMSILILLTSYAIAKEPISKGKLEGFEKSPFWGEQVKAYIFQPEVRVHINAPAEESINPNLPTRLVIYALPNGNTIEQTIGKKLKEGTDWHFDIQHIGAQTRQLRNTIKDANIIVAYVEASSKSWPGWRGKYPNNGQLIENLVKDIQKQIPLPKIQVELSSHSGGGSLIFGFINGQKFIPDYVTRLTFLDSTYAYSTSDHHPEKLIWWLKRDPHHCLNIISYDDRDVKLNGKNIVGPDQGTYRKTHKIIGHLEQEFPLSVTSTKDYSQWQGKNGQINITIVENPNFKILHTVLVEKNGYIHALTSGTPYQGKIADFWGDEKYRDLIQPE